MLTFDDIKNMKRGKEAEAEDRSSAIAARKLEEIAMVENQQNDQLDEESLSRDADMIIQELQSNPELDPHEVMASLPPVLEHAVMEKIQGMELGMEEEFIEPEGEESVEEEALEIMEGEELETVDAMVPTRKL